MISPGDLFFMPKKNPASPFVPVISWATTTALVADA